MLDYKAVKIMQRLIDEWAEQKAQEIEVEIRGENESNNLYTAVC